MKIVATLGPASATAQGVRALPAGARVFRITFRMPRRRRPWSASGCARPRRPRACRSALGDLAGPKIRIGQMAPDAFVKRGDLAASLPSKSSATPRASLSSGLSIILAPRWAPAVPGRRRHPAGDRRAGREARGRQGAHRWRDLLAQRLRRAPHVGHAFRAHGQGHQRIETLVPAGIDAFALSFVQSPADVRQVAKLLPPAGEAAVAGGQDRDAERRRQR